MKLRVKIIIIITILIVIVGWNAHKRDIVKVNETLHGESENWRASYTVDGFVEFTKSKEDRLGIEHDGNSELIISYKGKSQDLSEMRTFEVEQKHSWESRLYEESPILRTEFKYKNSVSAEDIYQLNKNKEIKIIVTWDGTNGSSEEIILK